LPLRDGAIIHLGHLDGAHAVAAGKELDARIASAVARIETIAGVSRRAAAASARVPSGVARAGASARRSAGRPRASSGARCRRGSSGTRSAGAPSRARRRGAIGRSVGCFRRKLAAAARRGEHQDGRPHSDHALHDS
jgi:hypothetical protein